MGNLPDIALWAALGGVLIVVALMVVTLGRRTMAWFLMRSMNRRVERVQLILRRHKEKQFKEVDRLLFQLGELQDEGAVETALNEVLADGQDEVRGKLHQVYSSLGLIERYIKTLEHDTGWAERTAAAQALGQLGAVSAIPALVNTMRDPHEDTSTVKRACAQALAEMRVDEAIPPLLAELERPDDWASPRLAEVLTAFGERAIDPLTASMADDKPVNIRAWAALILGRIDDRRAVLPLVARLADRSDRVRMAAAESLARLKDKRGLPELTKVAMRDPVAPVRAEAARALGAIGDESVMDYLVLMLGEADYWTRLRAVEAIEQLRPEDTSALESALTDDNEAVRSRAAVALERIGIFDARVSSLGSKQRAEAERAAELLTLLGRAGSVESLLACVEHEDFRVRARICEILWHVGDQRAVPSIVELLKDPMWPVRVRAVEAVEHLAPPDASTMLLPLLRDPEETVRVATVNAIKALGVPAESDESMQVVAQLFNEGNAEVRRSVIDAVREVQTDQVNDVLRQGLFDPNAEVRLRAAEEVGERANESWVEHLAACLGDADLRVRSAVVRALGRVHGPSALEALAGCINTPDRAFRETLTDVLALQGVEAILDVTGRDESIESQLARVWALGKTGDQVALDYMERLIDSGEAELRAAIAGAASKYNDDRAETILMRLLGDPNERVRAAAVNGVGVLGRERNLSALMLLLDDPDPFVCNRVALAMGRIGSSAARQGLDYMYHRSEGTKAYAVVGFGLLGDDLGFQIAIAALADSELRAKIIELLKREPEDVRQRFRENLKLEDGSPEVLDRLFSTDALRQRYITEVKSSRDVERRVQALQALAALGNIGNDAELMLSVARTDPAPEMRRLALVNLIELVEEKNVTRAFLAALKDPVSTVQTAAVRGLHELKDPVHNEPLIASFAGAEGELQGALVDALTAANEHRVHDFLDNIMGHTDPKILRGGADVLGRIADPRAHGVLARWVGSTDLELRRTSVLALSKIGTVDAKETLLECLSDPVEDVRLATVMALGQMPAVGIIEALGRATRDPSVEVRRQLASQLGNSRELAAVHLAQQLCNDPEDTVRYEAMVSLLDIGDDGSYRAFLESYKVQLPSVISRLSELTSEHPALAVAVEKVATSPRADLRQLSLEVLGTLRACPVETLVRAMADPEPQVRIAAFKAAEHQHTEDVAVDDAIQRLLRDPVAEVQEAVRKVRLRLVAASDDEQGDS